MLTIAGDPLEKLVISVITDDAICINATAART